MDVIKSKTPFDFLKSSKKIRAEKMGELKFVCQDLSHSSESWRYLFEPDPSPTLHITVSIILLEFFNIYFLTEDNPSTWVASQL